MPLDIEEELDLTALGFEGHIAVDRSHKRQDLGVSTVPRGASSSLRSSPLVRRAFSGGYVSADWTPSTTNATPPVTPPAEQITENEPVDEPSLEAEARRVITLPRKISLSVKVARIPGSRHRRKAIRVVSRVDPSSDEFTDGQSHKEVREIPVGPCRDFADVFGNDVYVRIESMAKLNATTGSSLPPSVRDLFPALSDLSTAIPLVNSVRQSLDLPSIRVTKSNRVDLLRSIAQLRSSLYITLVASLSVPLAPATDLEEEAESEEEEKITLTPDNLKKLGSVLPKAFAAENALLRAFLADDAKWAYGELGGTVVWQGGIGRVFGAEGGFRGKNLQDGEVHVFLDHSNVLYGLLHCLYSNPSDSLPPKHLRTLSLPALSLLLRRGRATPPGTLHAVASSPLKQDLDPLVRLGWDVSVLKRVEIQEDEVEDPAALNLTPKPKPRLPKGAEVNGLRRFKEQAVDEILQLKMLQAMNARESGGTIVLATGDAKGGQFNRDGFLGAVREALRRGWAVELWSFRAGLSRAWIETGKRERWFSGGSHSHLSIHHFDEWAEWLVDV